MPGAQTPSNHIAEATQEALKRTRERLREMNLAQAAARGGLELDSAGRVRVNFLGRELRVVPKALIVEAINGAPVPAGDEVLVLRYLEAEREIRLTGEDITFRQLPGGNFYFGPVQNRTSKLLLKVFGNDLARFEAALARYPFERLPIGDLGVKIHAIGRLDVTFIYRLGDEEFPPTLDILYDRAISGVYHTDEVAALATRICLGLMKKC